MAVTLNNSAKKRSVSDLRAEYVAAHKEATVKLEKVLRLLIDDHREAYQTHISNMLIEDVELFMARRNPNQTPRDVYDPDAKGGMERVMLQEAAASMEALLLKLTTYKERKDDPWDGRLGVYIRPDFPIKFKRNYRLLAYAEAGKKVERTVKDFISRTNDKLIDIFVVHPDYEAKLVHGSFVSGVFEALICLYFPRPKNGFSIRLSLKYNRSKYNKHFVQYPLTFCNYTTDSGVKKIFSEEEALMVYGAKKWEPPKQPKRGWTKIKNGCVVRSAHGIGLVIGTRKGMAQILTTDNKQISLAGDSITEIMAMIEARYNFRGSHYARFYSNDGTNSRIDIAEDATGAPTSYQGAEAILRKMYFEQLVKEKAFEPKEVKP